MPVPNAGKSAPSDSTQMEFEAKSARDGAWLVFSSCCLTRLGKFVYLMFDICQMITLGDKPNCFVCFLRYDVAGFLSHRYLDSCDPVILKLVPPCID